MFKLTFILILLNVFFLKPMKYYRSYRAWTACFGGLQTYIMLSGLATVRMEHSAEVELWDILFLHFIIGSSFYFPILLFILFLILNVFNLLILTDFEVIRWQNMLFLVKWNEINFERWGQIHILHICWILTESEKRLKKYWETSKN